MSKYEAIVVFSVKNGDDVSALVEKFKALIEKSGTLDSVEEWGKRRLAYPINKKEEGYYVVVDFKGNPTLPKELDRRLKISDYVFRHIIINNDAQ